MASHRVFTIVADIIPGREDALRALDPDFQPGGQTVALRQPSFAHLAMVHYASITVFDRERLATERSKLVFECNIDGGVDQFLARLVDDPAIDGIYQHCESYPGDADSAAKRQYLKNRVRRPHLYHIGTPYRSVDSIRRDRDLRDQVAVELDRAMRPTLTDYRGGTLPGIREYWISETLAPWIAWLVGIGIPAAAVWMARAAWGRPWWVKWTVTVLCVAVALGAVARAVTMWSTAVPELRDRVRPWIPWALGAVLLAVVAPRAWPAYQRGTLVAVGLFLLLAVWKASAAAARLANERLQIVRANAEAPSVVSVWKALGPHALKGDHVDWVGRVANWSVWPIAFGLTWAAIDLMQPRRWLLVSVVTTLFFVEGLALTVLLGWPARDRNIPQNPQPIVTFVAGVPIVTFLALVVLTALDIPSWLLAGLVIGGVLGIVGVGRPSPEIQPLVPDRRAIAESLDAEDHDVTNHMSAVVILNQDRWFRAPVLRGFLWMMDTLYFHSLLPDLYRGKLWGIPTVHFAQWVMLDDRNFLFFSNYDHSWSSYLDDFGLQLTTGIQKIWGQGRDNPGTGDLGRFKDFARSTMVRHSVWYRAYPGLTVRQVWNNEQIRRAVAGASDEEAMMHALRRFGAAPKTLPDLAHGRSV